MRYDMNLNESPFRKIAEGSKTVELRLNDEKRQMIRENDVICFHNANNEYDVIKCRVTGIRRFTDFMELYKCYDKVSIGYEPDETADYRDMLEYYSLEQQKKHGVVALEIEKTNEPYLVDGHMHLEHGDLSEEYVMKFVDEAVKKGLDEIDILDHTHRFVEFSCCYDHLRRYKEQEDWLNGPYNLCSSIEEYLELIEKMKSKSLPVKVKFGLEVCYTPYTNDMMTEILSKYHFDFLTGAVHSINHILYDLPFSKELLWENVSADQIYHDYYDAVMGCVETGLFDRLAHPDTIKLFNIYPEYDLKPTYERLSQKLKEKGMMAECNTGCHYRYGHDDIGLSDELLRVFVDNDVPIITTSDAHEPEYTGNYIHEAVQRIERARNEKNKGTE